MNFSDYLNPAEISNSFIDDPLKLGNLILHYNKDISIKEVAQCNLAILGVPEDRSCSNSGCANAPDVIRKKLYDLYFANESATIIDLGNIKLGNTINDTYYAVKEVVSELLRLNIVTIILGGSQDITYGNYMAYAGKKKTINISSIDSRFDINQNDKYNSYSYISRIVLEEDNYLFNYTNIGYQTYFVSQEDIDLMSRLFFDCYRLGFVRSNIKEVEPIVRDSDIVSIDISSVRFSDAPANINVSPNGFLGDEICQIVKYAGLSDRVSTFGIYEVNPLLDSQKITSSLAAQMVWYFIEGFQQRKNENPQINQNDYIKYIVTLDNKEQDITFLKSIKTDRWWVEVPKRLNNKRNLIVACSYDDYKKACNHEIPDRWWKTFQKIN